MKEGDLVRYRDNDENDSYGEISTVSSDGVELFRLQRTRDQGGRIWRLNDGVSIVQRGSVLQHVSLSSPLTRSVVKAGWRELGFMVDIDDFARTADFEAGRVTLRIEALDEGDDAADAPGVGDDYDYDDGFVVADEVANEPFTFADPSTLSDADAAWVRETHDAVRKYNHWNPTDRSGVGIKAFVDNLARRASNDANNMRWSNRMREIDCKVPPS